MHEISQNYPETRDDALKREGRQAQVHGRQKFGMTTRKGKTVSEMKDKEEEKKDAKNSHQRPSAVIR